MSKEEIKDRILIMEKDFLNSSFAKLLSGEEYKKRVKELQKYLTLCPKQSHK